MARTQARGRGALDRPVPRVALLRGGRLAGLAARGQGEPAAHLQPARRLVPLPGPLPARPRAPVVQHDAHHGQRVVHGEPVRRGGAHRERDDAQRQRRQRRAAHHHRRAHRSPFAKPVGLSITGVNVTGLDSSRVPRRDVTYRVHIYYLSTSTSLKEKRALRIVKR